MRCAARRKSQKIVERKADYLFFLKGNQEKIHEDAKDFFNHELDEKYCERYKIQKFSCDTVFNEDYCRVRKDSSPQNLNIIRKLVMNLLRGLDLPIATKNKNLTIGNKQILCSKKEKCLLYALQNL